MKIKQMITEAEATVAKIDAIANRILQNFVFDESKYHLGILCKRNHEWKNSGHTLRRYRKDKETGTCLECEKISNKKWKKANPEKVKAAIKKWRNKNPEKIKTDIKRWRAKNAEKVREYSKRYNKENAEKIEIRRKIYWPKYYKANSEKIKTTAKKWCIENPEKAKAYNKKYYKENAEKIKKKVHEWTKKHPENSAIRSKRDRKNIVDHYIKSLLKTKHKLSEKQITSQLIQIKRLQIKGERITKKLLKEEG